MNQITNISGNNNKNKNVRQLRKKSKDNDVLQGYLLIHSNIQQEQSSPLVNLRKKRWFVFNKENGKLYYYRTREDLFPLGEIDINQSSFILANPTTGVDTDRNCSWKKWGNCLRVAIP